MRTLGLFLVALAAFTAVGTYIDASIQNEVAAVADVPATSEEPVATAPVVIPAGVSMPMPLPAVTSASIAGASAEKQVPARITSDPVTGVLAESEDTEPVSVPSRAPAASATSPLAAAEPSPGVAPLRAEVETQPGPKPGSVAMVPAQTVPARPSGNLPSAPALPPAAQSPPPATAPVPGPTPTGPPLTAGPPPPPSGPADPRNAKEAFGAVKTASPLAARAIGFYSRGCLAGAKMLPVDGPAWQAMRLSRNRNWGHPDLVRYVERLAVDVRAHDGWPGLMVGDLSQPRGGPMRTGHASHQIGLDADIWFTPMPDRRLTPKEREDIAATDMLGNYKLTVDPAVWTPTQVKLIKRAASYREVERVLVHPAIKKALCDAAGSDREWLKKVRPYWGHHYHFHVRIACPAGSPTCSGQAPPPSDDGCGKELDDWFALLSRPAKSEPPAEPTAPSTAPPRSIRVDQLPGECRQVLDGREPFLRRLFRSPAAAKAAEKAQNAGVQRAVAK